MRIHEKSIGIFLPDVVCGAGPTTAIAPALTHIRGNVIAADSIARALLTEGHADCHVFVQPYCKRLLAGRPEFTKPYVAVHSLDDIIRTGGAVPELQAWLNPLPTVSARDGIELSHRIRSAYSQQIYPIMLLTHGLSIHRMLYDFYLRLILEGAYPFDCLICTSQASRKATRNIMNTVLREFNREYHTHLTWDGRIELIPLCVDTAMFRPLPKDAMREKLKIPLGAFVLLFIGRLSLLKAELRPMLHVFATLVKRHATHKLVLILCGTEDKGEVDMLQQHARDLGIGELVRVCLNISHTDKAELLPAADVLLAPADSPQESFGLTPIEAMACGVPQVVADWDGYRDTVQHGKTGFLVPTYWTGCDGDLRETAALGGWMYDHMCLGQSVALDLDKLREYVSCLLQNGEIRAQMSHESRERAVNNYSHSAVANQYYRLVCDLALAAADYHGARQVKAVFSRPAYYQWFAHYASMPLSPDARVCVSDMGRLFAGSCDKSSASHCSGYIIDDGVVRLLLAMAVSCGQAQGKGDVSNSPCRIQELVSSAKAVGVGPSAYIYRHVMWLIKHGYLNVSPH